MQRSFESGARASWVGRRPTYHRDGPQVGTGPSLERPSRGQLKTFWLEIYAFVQHIPSGKASKEEYLTTVLSQHFHYVARP